MPLYERPELLTPEDHGHLGLRNLPQPLAFAREARAVPLMVTEFRSAQRYCPIVFTDREKPFPMAALGVVEQRNLLMNESGEWRVPGYIPAYLRCYPFALATMADGRYAMVVDRAADVVSDQPDVPFFENGDLSGPLQERLELCRTYKAEKERTEAFCAMLERLDLLVQQEATHSIGGEERIVARYFVVSSDKLMKLDKDTIDTMFRDGSLAAILAHLFSLDSFEELVRLRQLRGVD
jgi:hypothetical protein